MANFFLFFIFILFSGFFSLSETAIFSLSSFRLKHLQKYHNISLIKKLLKNPTKILSTIIFGNMLVNIGFSALSTIIFVKSFGDSGLFLAIFISGFFILFLGEILPKTFAIYLYEKLSIFSAPFLNILSKIFYPFVFFLEKTANFFFYFVRIFLKKRNSLDNEELRIALFLSRKEGYITLHQEEMINYVLEFKDIEVKEIMVLNTEIKGIDSTLTQQEVVNFIKEKKHSKFPVYKKNLNNIVGILYAKDLFFNPNVDYHRLIRAPLFVQEDKRIGFLLKLFLEKDERIAIVLDRHFKTVGLITLEDIQEEILGEIYDEFEIPQEQIEEIGKNIYRVYGKTSIKDLNLKLNLELPEIENNIANFIISKFERIPHIKEKLYIKNIEIEIERATPKRIISLILKKD
ncbi:MAG: hemolysin family protein [Candidatus Aenigmatarchaeota archaeon]